VQGKRTCYQLDAGCAIGDPANRDGSRSGFNLSTLVAVSKGTQVTKQSIND
jgi:hypothetical protein